MKNELEPPSPEGVACDTELARPLAERLAIKPHEGPLKRKRTWFKRGMKHPEYADFALTVTIDFAYGGMTSFSLKPGESWLVRRVIDTFLCDRVRAPVHRHDHHLAGLTYQRKGIHDCTAGLARILPRNEGGIGRNALCSLCRNEDRPTSLQHEI